MRRPRLLLALAPAVATLLVAGGCIPTGGSVLPVATSTPTSAKVELTTERLLGRWGPEVDATSRTDSPWVRFAHDGTLMGFDGCNQVVGRWTLEPGGSTVRSDVRLASYAACPSRPRIDLSQLTFDGNGLRYHREGAGWGTMTESGASEIVMYLIESDSRSLRPVPVPIEPPDRSEPQERAEVGVAALLAADEAGDRFSSFWGRTCGLATGVESVEPPTGEMPAIVRLTGQGGGLCDLTRQAGVLRQQQLAWTVVTNLAIAPRSPVRVLGPGDKKLFDDVTSEAVYVAG